MKRRVWAYDVVGLVTNCFRIQQRRHGGLFVGILLQLCCNCVGYKVRDCVHAGSLSPRG